MGIELNPKIIKFLIAFPLLMISIVLHELSHAYTAYKLGDDTAKNMGRLTLNPLKHIDLFGTILLPLISLFSGFSLIGWAKPVPINPGNFRNYKRDDFLVSIAGPLSNFLLVFIFFLLSFVVPQTTLFSTNNFVLSTDYLFLYGILINLFLGFFNLLPVPPLDGFHVINSALNFRLSPIIEKFGWMGIFILIFLINSPLWRYFSNFVSTIFNALVMLSGKG